MSSSTARYIVLDTETGGLESNLTLLSVYLLCLNEERVIIDKLELNIKPDDGVYKLTAAAMAVNKINFVEHDKKAIPESQAKKKFIEFLELHSNTGKNKLKLVSHSTTFDLRWLQAKFLTIEEWEIYFNRRPVDTQNASVFLQEAGLLPDTLSCSLVSMADYF